MASGSGPGNMVSSLEPDPLQPGGQSERPKGVIMEMSKKF